MASRTIQLLLATCLLSAFVARSYGTRYVIVGDPKAKDGSFWTHKGVNYTNWMKSNPLRVGDIAVFKYGTGLHVVGLLPSKKAYDQCSYKSVKILGNSKQGGGKGVQVKVTKTPQYIGCMIFGHCEKGQKVILVGK